MGYAILKANSSVSDDIGLGGAKKGEKKHAVSKAKAKKVKAVERDDLFDDGEEQL